jgi:acyl-homoserine-lactone acylase
MAKIPSKLFSLSVGRTIGGWAKRLAFFTMVCGAVAREPAGAAAAPELWREVEVLRTEHGVPHVRADTMRAAGYALGWLQCEDYGSVTPERLWSTRGQTARVKGRRAIEDDFDALRRRARANETYHLLEPETRDLCDGFALGVNRYVARHRAEFAAHITPDFSGYDVATLTIGPGPSAARVGRFLAALKSGLNTPVAEPAEPDTPPEEGSNAWALAPSRTVSGKAILLRNPHLAWSAGYYEAHVTVPGVLDFYGDFRIGGPLGVVGGFNRHLGWSTTNSNTGDLTVIYAVPADPAQPDHYRLDGVSLPLRSITRTVHYRDGDKQAAETRELWESPLGPVVHRTSDTVYLARTAGDGEFRAGEQFLRLMRATSEAQWLEGMRLRAKTSQNYTYADRAGNILILSNASYPALPHPPTKAAAVAATSLREIWTQLIPFADLPLVRNPRGGYVHNENSSPHFANVREPVVLTNRHPNMERPMLSLRSQLGIELIDTETRLSLEDVVRLKHSYRMLLAERTKPELIRAVEATQPSGEVAAALDLLRRWDTTTAPDRRGGVLFSVWWQRYAPPGGAGQPYAAPWTESDPLKTPRGLADPARAAAAFAEAVAETARRHGRWDVAWGEVYRLRRGGVDVPVGGGSGQLGHFRVLTFAREPDGKYAANGGDGWVLAVEFGDEPRAYSVLAYGQSAKPASPWHADQAAMFARGEVKPVRFGAAEVDQHVVTRYRPGAATEP